MRGEPGGLPLGWFVYDLAHLSERMAWYGTLIDAKRDAAGTHYRRARAYDPATGRFTQEDPIGLTGGVNLYGYAGGDPANFSDPFGLCVPWPSCALAAGAVGSRIGTVVGAGAGAILGLGGGAIPGAVIGNRAGWVIGAGVATAGAIYAGANAWLNTGASDDAEAADTPLNPDGTRKTPGQQYEEISEAQRRVRQRNQGDRIQSTRKSKQRDRRELDDEAERALEALRQRRRNPGQSDKP